MKCGRYGCTLEGDFLVVWRGGEKKYWIEPQKYWIGPACAYGQSLYQRFRPGSMWLKSLLSLHLNHILTYATFLPIFSTSVQFSSVHTHSSAAIQKKKNGGRVFLFFFFFGFVEYLAFSLLLHLTCTTKWNIYQGLYYILGRKAAKVSLLVSDQLGCHFHAHIV